MIAAIVLLWFSGAVREWCFQSIFVKGIEREKIAWRLFFILLWPLVVPMAVLAK